MWKKLGVSNSSGGAGAGGFVVSLCVTFSIAIIGVAIQFAVSSLRNNPGLAHEDKKKEKKAAITARGKGDDDDEKTDAWEEKKDDTAATTTPALASRATTEGALANPMFVASADRIKNLPNNASLYNRDKLQLYSLYKQATVGNAPKWFTPSSFDLLVEQAKHHAWSQLRGMPWQEATQTYIQVAQALLLQGNKARQHDDDDDDDESIDHDALSDDEVDYNRPKTTNCNVPSSSPRGNNNNNKNNDTEPGGFGVGVSRPMAQEEEEEDVTDNSAENSTGIKAKKPPHVALLQAAAKNDVQTIQRLISEQKQEQGGADAVRRLVDHHDEVGQTALHRKSYIHCQYSIF
jgi:acyl-CoA-binding protein